MFFKSKESFLEFFILFFVVIISVAGILFFRNSEMETLNYSVVAGIFFLGFMGYIITTIKLNLKTKNLMFYILAGIALFLSTLGLCIVLVQNKPIIEMLISKVIYVFVVGAMIILGSKVPSKKKINILVIVSSAFVLSSFAAQRILKENNAAEFVMLGIAVICIFATDIAIIMKSYINGEK
ncbi:hypothetical protein [Fusobacterium sp. MFO224]|uniref:hypothetical protein n=1 Tax=Fusobacterium sp. MFO224 TaxID=3378070 RepID=UPI003854CB7C